MDQLGDKLSSSAKRALDFLFVANPVGTSLGVFTGFILDGLLQVAIPVLSTIKILRFSALRTWHLCAIGIVGFNLRPYIRRNKIDSKIVEALSFIEKESKRLQLPEWQRRKMYGNLFAKVLADVVLNAEAKNDIVNLYNSVSNIESSYNDSSKKGTITKK